MAASSQASPGFGTADLSNCEREQIHLAASIQPFGALLVVREPDLRIVQASANAEAFLGLSIPLVGAPLEVIPGNLPARLAVLLGDLADLPMGLHATIGAAAAPFTGMVHRPPEGGIVIELERRGPPLDLSQPVQEALGTIAAAPSLAALCDDVADVVQGFTGYDRVMVYRFDEEGHGQVFSERKTQALESFLGNWYPASDIPQMARRLYERNRIRLLVDVDYAPVPLVPRLSGAGRDLDMSMCVLRSMSPLHIQYLKNMGVGATLVMSLMVGGKLWGLVACHHYAPRHVAAEVRAVCEVLAEAIATRISALDAFAQAQAELAVRRLEQRMVHSIARAGDWTSALFDDAQTLLAPLDAEGAALLLDGDVVTIGEVPGTQEIRAVGAWLAARPPVPVTASASLREGAPDLHYLMPHVGGVLATPVSTSPGDYLVWFRPERIKTVTWGGNPSKPFTVGTDPKDLSPRRSFAQWHELVEGTCEPWTPANRRTGRLIGETVADVVLQFRSVRMLIAQDQLNSVGRQVRASDQPVLIADARGRVILTNAAFDGLLGGQPAPADVQALAACFSGSAVAAQSISQLTLHRRSWRGEAVFQAGPESGIPLLIRADAVQSAPGRVLGFVFLFMDISERRAVETARQRFQESLAAPQTAAATRIATPANPLYDRLMSTVIENAQVAALEITDGFDMARIPDALDSIRTSVGRAARVLEGLVGHVPPAANDDN